MKITNIVKYTSDKLYVYVQIINNETLLFPLGSYTWEINKSHAKNGGIF